MKMSTTSEVKTPATTDPEASSTLQSVDVSKSGHDCSTSTDTGQMDIIEPESSCSETSSVSGSSQYGLSHSEMSYNTTSSTSSCECQSCQNIRAEKRELRKMNFEHSSTMSEFYPGKTTGHFDRCTLDSCSNIYDNVDSIPRGHNEMYGPYSPSGPFYHLRHCFPIWSFSTPSAECSPTSLTKILDRRSASPESNNYKQCCSQETFVGVSGIMGIVLGSAGLLAYLILQIPEFRENLGPNYATVEGRSADSIYNPSTLIYSVELTGVILASVIGILVNALLVFGVRRRSSYFLLPWLFYHTLFIIGLIVAVILIICFAYPFVYRIFALIPAFSMILFSVVWLKVYKTYVRFRCEIQTSGDAAVNVEESWYASAGQPTPSGSWE